ncbi:PrsW family intramembrane metalloprotease [Nocardioides mesophilus]|uniref:PrsW family intramembrane metalloprotease n=1 Tax=Nocardioides mesophilus TaxID=433659 RepID=A0A7G9RCV0_9ACTN|nr:PrsW family intramembrane metalloprotease [Nocardioides mesophilus]QNN53425.1 PrsW family intramembrane metalloprotease [Nocardioides mesophilus]
MSGAGGLGHAHAASPAPPPLTGRRRNGNVLFTLVLSVLMLLGAVVMALVLVASSAPAGLVIGVVLAALPVGPVIGAFLWLDRYEPEPVRLLLSAFGWGAVVATAGALLLQTLDRFVLGTAENWSAAIVAPITEEAAKGLFILLLLWWRRHEIDGILDGIVYAGLVGVGFAFTENILYLGSAYMGGDGVGPGGLGSAIGVFVVRGVFSPFAHPLFTTFIGVGVGYAVTHRGAARVLAPLLGYVLAVAAHALWNGSAFFAGGQYFVLTYLFAMVPAFLMLAVFATWARSREATMLTRALQDAAARGYLGQAEVPWLVRLPARRASRAYALRAGGPTAERVMRDYQQEAIELGFLHDRYLRGTAPVDFAERGTVMVQRMAALRPHVLFPPVAGGPAAFPPPSGSGPRGGPVR